MRRGFKAWCERVSAEYRRALGVHLATALDPRRLAEHLNVRVLMPEDVPDVPAASLAQLRGSEGRASWSAVTVSQGGARLVILNSGHPSTRQANSLAHELAHVILNHTSDDTRWSPQGILFRSKFNDEQEDEANWLAASLLLPRQGLLQAYRRRPDPEALAQHFGVSLRLLNWRLGITGIRRQARRAAALRAVASR